MPSSAASAKDRTATPSPSRAFRTGGQPQVLDRAGQRGEIHFRQGAAAEQVPLAAIHQRGDQQFGAVLDALDLEPQELGGPLAQRHGRALALLATRLAMA